MNSYLTFCLLILPLVLWSVPTSANNTFRIAAWNIADFHHQAGVEARKDIGTRRYPADFSALKKYADQLDADIIALQEIVTEQAARRLFPASHYWLFMSSRVLDDQKVGHQPDIYTALAVRKGVGIKPVKRADLTALEIQEKQFGSNTTGQFHRATRRGTAVLLELQGQALWVMSVHLKSSCANVKKMARSRQRACKMLWQQSLILKEWVDDKINEGADFIIAGDFNRRFGRLKGQGAMWNLLNRSATGNPLIVRFPQTQLRRCPTRKGKGVHPIDWFLISTRFSHFVVPGSYFETRWNHTDAQAHGRRLSDHCPIHIDLAL